MPSCLWHSGTKLRSQCYGPYPGRGSTESTVCLLIHVTGSEKTDHFVIILFVQYGPKVLPRSQSRDFTISTP